MTRTVSAEPGVASIVARTIATLPVSLTWGEHAAELRTAFGRAGWPGRAVEAAQSGALGLLVVHPTAITLDQLEALRTGLGRTALVLDWEYSSNPVVDQLTTWRAETPGLLECTALAPVGADTARQLLEITAWLRHTLGAELTASATHRIAGGTWMAGAVHLHGIRSTGIMRVLHTDATTPRLEIAWAGQTQRLEATFFPPDTARPAVITVTDERGDQTLPAIFENAHRTGWQRLLNAVDTRGTISADMDHLLDAVGLAASPT